MADLAPAGSPLHDDEVLAPYLHLIGPLQDAAPLEGERARLVLAAAGLAARPGFETLLCKDRLRFVPFEHQLHAAAVVLRQMRGRAILADEVGLGKTIEAGLVCSELRLRGLARSILVLCPAGLVEQWQEELDRKFALPSVVVGRDDELPGGPEPPIAICSLPSARRAPLSARLGEWAWDLVIIDEAHRVKNPRTASSTLVRALRCRHLLLLTATPVENRLSDLFNLVSLVAPGLLGTAAQFRTRHGSDAERAPLAISELRGAMGEVMVRHRRSEVALMLPKRLAETRLVSPGEAEAALYRAVAERVRAEGADAGPARAMALRSLLRAAGSSPAALAETLASLDWAPALLADALAEGSAKVRALLEVLSRLRVGSEKVLVFTAFRKSQDELAAAIAAAGIPAAVYHGGLSRKDKERAIASFAADVPVLISTEAAGEGRNLQFCHQMVNFDLPWNPMQIEQRLGRLHRIGQSHDVAVVNLATRGTIEEQILAVLEHKINLFELVVGELDMILGHIEEDYDFEREVFAAHLASSDGAEFAGALEAIGERLVAARRDYLDSRERNDDLALGEQERDLGG